MLLTTEIRHISIYFLLLKIYTVGYVARIYTFELWLLFWAMERTDISLIRLLAPIQKQISIAAANNKLVIFKVVRHSFNSL
jgi:cytochrome b561